MGYFLGLKPFDGLLQLHLFPLAQPFGQHLSLYLTWTIVWHFPPIQNLSTTTNSKNADKQISYLYLNAPPLIYRPFQPFQPTKTPISPLPAGRVIPAFSCSMWQKAKLAEGRSRRLKWVEISSEPSLDCHLCDQFYFLKAFPIKTLYKIKLSVERRPQHQLI